MITIHAHHIEKPEKEFFVTYYHKNYIPDGFPFAFPGREKTEKVLAETPEGATKIAKYHHFMFGSDFRLSKTN